MATMCRSSRPKDQVCAVYGLEEQNQSRHCHRQSPVVPETRSFSGSTLNGASGGGRIRRDRNGLAKCADRSAQWLWPLGWERRVNRHRRSGRPPEGVPGAGKADCRNTVVGLPKRRSLRPTVAAMKPAGSGSLSPKIPLPTVFTKSSGPLFSCRASNDDVREPLPVMQRTKRK